MSEIKLSYLILSYLILSYLILSYHSKPDFVFGFISIQLIALTIRSSSAISFKQTHTRTQTSMGSVLPELLKKVLHTFVYFGSWIM